MQKSISKSLLESMIQGGALQGVKSFEELVEKAQQYKSARSWDRKSFLEAPVGAEELEILKDVLDVNNSLKDLDQKWQPPQGDSSRKAKQTALRLVYQNKAKLGL